MSKKAIILAGGKGTRLRPYTMTIPKPLVPVGEIPILEIIIRQLEKTGFSDIIITVNHQAEYIMAFFGNGKNFGVNIEYSLEEKPLGTMGPLKKIENLPEDFLVMNGDVLTDLDFGRLFEYHIKKNKIFTISSNMRAEKIEYGVLETGNSNELKAFREKPDMKFLVSMGVYIINRRILNYIPENSFFGFDDLMLHLLECNETVNVRTHNGFWLDIGNPNDYEYANLIYKDKIEKWIK